MKKILVGIILIVLIVALGVGLSSCFNKSGSLKVTFYVDGSVYATVKFNKGDHEIELPANPTIEGKNFVRWEYDKPETGEKAEFLKDTIWHYQSSMDVYACFDDNLSNYIVNENGNAIIGIKDKTATEYVIPEKINGITIDKIEQEVFKDNKNIVSVSIPKTMRYIEKAAFENCENLKTVTFAEDTEELNLRMDVFKDCTSIEEIVLPYGLSQTQLGVFAGCTSLTKITTPFVGIRNPTTTSVDGKYYCLGTFFGSDTEIPVKDLIITKQKYIFSYIFNESKVENLTISSADLDLSSSFGYYMRETLKTVDISNSNATELDYSSFEGCGLLTSVKLPSSLESIGGRAFYGCTSMESLDIPTNVKSIGFNTFTNCNNLKNIDISKVETIDSNAFNGCLGITALDGSSLKTIAYNAFANMTNLETMTLRDVETIGNGAFMGDVKLTSFSNPALTKLTTIGENAFEGCSLLTTIHLAKSVETIGKYAFKDCSALTTFDIEAGSSLTSMGQNAFSGANSIASITLPFIADTPTSTKAFGYIFRNTGSASSYEYLANGYYVPKSLTSITITSGTSIAQSALRGLTYVTTISLPDTIETINQDALENAGITSLVVPHSLTELNSRIGTGGDVDLYIESIAHYMAFTQGVIVANENNKLRLFVGQNEVTNLDLSSLSLTEISPYKFHKCQDIISLTLPNTVAQIGSYAFFKTGISGITFPTALTTIKTHAFDGSNINAVTLNPNLATIEAYAFANTQISTLTVPNNVTTIMGFDHIPTLTTVNFEANSTLETILTSCFAYTGITSITIPASVETIGASAFANCSALETVSFESGSNLTTVESSGFAYTGITSIIIPASVTNLGNFAFYGDSSLETLTFETGTSITDIGSEFISGTKIDTLEIPSTIGTMSNNIFKGALYLINLTYPAKKKWTDLGSNSAYVYVTINSSSICENGFYNATNVTSLDISNVTQVGATAFNGMSALTKLYISSWNDYLNIDFNGSTFEFYHNNREVNIYVNGTLVSGTFDLSGIDSSITSIPKNIFYKLRSITNLILPITITSIEDGAFDYCTNLVDVKFKDGSSSPAYTNNLVSIGKYAFRKTDLSKIVISNDTTTIGNYAFSECTHLDASFESNSTLQTIGEYAFNNVSGLTAFEIPSTLISIGQYAFASTGLQTITLAANSTLTSIGSAAFANCTSLTTLPVFPASLNSLGAAAFRGCTQITTVDLRNTSVSTIHNLTFRDDAALTHVYLSKYIRTLGSEAFLDCTALISVECIENNLYPIEVKSSCFKNCENLVSVGYGDWAAVETYVINFIDSVSTKNPDVRDRYMDNHYAEFSIIDLVEDYAFYGCRKLENIRLSSDVSKIGKYAFYDCANLKYINIPHYCSHLDYMSFGGEAFKNTLFADQTGMTTAQKKLHETYGMAIEFYDEETQIVWEYHNSTIGSMNMSTDVSYKINDSKRQNTSDLKYDCQNVQEKLDKNKTGVRKRSVS